MIGSRNRWRLFEVPHAAVYLLLIVNVVVFGLCLSRSGTAAVSADVLFCAGAKGPPLTACAPGDVFFRH